MSNHDGEPLYDNKPVAGSGNHTAHNCPCGCSTEWWDKSTDSEYEDDWLDEGDRRYQEAKEENNNA